MKKRYAALLTVGGLLTGIVIGRAPALPSAPRQPAGEAAPIEQAPAVSETPPKRPTDQPISTDPRSAAQLRIEAQNSLSYANENAACLKAVIESQPLTLSQDDIVEKAVSSCSNFEGQVLSALRSSADPVEKEREQAKSMVHDLLVGPNG